MNPPRGLQDPETVQRATEATQQAAPEGQPDAAILALEQQRQALVAEAKCNSEKATKAERALPKKFLRFPGVVVGRQHIGSKVVERSAATVEEINEAARPFLEGPFLDDQGAERARQKRDQLVADLEAARAEFDQYADQRAAIEAQTAPLDKANEALHDRIFSLEERIIRAPAHTLTGVRVKLEIEAALAREQVTSLDEANVYAHIALFILDDLERIEGAGS